MKTIYTLPKLNNTSKHWYIHFRYDGKQWRFTEGINKIVDIVEREYEYEKLRRVITARLERGWNPNIIEGIHQQQMQIIPALTFALEKKKPNISKKTYSGYNGTVNFISDAIKKLSIENIYISEIKRSHIKMIIESAKETKSWSNKAHNKHLNHLKAVLSELIQWDIIEVNPAFNVKNLTVIDADANNPASYEDIEKIKKELQMNHANFYTFVISLFHTGIRPAELLQIRLSNINLKRKEITLYAENTKTNKKRIVPINDHLLKYYESMDFQNLPKEYYLFGSFREQGKGNIGKLEDFIPAPTKIKRDTATRRWETIVKKGLGIDATLYSMKHHGANAKILAGVNLDALKDLFGHTSKLMTEKYVTDLKEINRKEIINKSPDF